MARRLPVHKRHLTSSRRPDNRLLLCGSRRVALGVMLTVVLAYQLLSQTGTPLSSSQLLLSVPIGSNNKNGTSSIAIRQPDDDDDALLAAAASMVYAQQSSRQGRRQQSLLVSDSTTANLPEQEQHSSKPISEASVERTAFFPRVLSWSGTNLDDDIYTKNNTSSNRTVTPMSNYSLTNEKDHDDISYLPFERVYQQDCVPMASWQTQHFPTCNIFHEVSLGDAALYLDNKTTTSNVSTTDYAHQLQLVSLGGSWRSVWRYDTPSLHTTAVALKLLHWRRPFDAESFEHHRVDAMSMERLTSSPYIVSAYGHCGPSVLTEWSDTTARLYFKRHDLRSRDRVRIGRDLVRAVRDVHAIDAALLHKENTTTATLAHNDINIANAVVIQNKTNSEIMTVKLNDFNIATMLKWKPESHQPCGVPVKFAAPLWKSPEENANISYIDPTKADVYATGNLLFQVMTERQPWTHLEPDGKLTVEQVAQRKAARQVPYIPSKYRHSSKIGIQALYYAVLACFQFDPERRPTAHKLAEQLNVAVGWAFNDHRQNVTRDDVRRLFGIEEGKDDKE